VPVAFQPSNGNQLPVVPDSRKAFHQLNVIRTILRWRLGFTHDNQLFVFHRHGNLLGHDAVQRHGDLRDFFPVGVPDRQNFQIQVSLVAVDFSVVSSSGSLSASCSKTASLPAPSLALLILVSV